MLQGSMSMWSGAELSDPLLWSTSYQPGQGRQHVKKRLGQGTVALTLFPSSHSRACCPPRTLWPWGGHT